MIFKTVFIFYLVLAVAKGQVRDIASYGIPAERMADYIKSNQDQHTRYVVEFDKILENFKQHFTGRIESLNMQTPLTVASVLEMDEYLDPLELMGDLSHECVEKNRFLSPTVVATKSALQACWTQASNELPNLLKDPQNYRNAMFNYFNSYFETESKKCGTTYAKTSTNYTSCVTTVIRNTNNNVVVYKKTFDNMMDLAECTAKSHLKRLADCILTVQSRTTAQIAEAKVTINNCLMGKDNECKPCPVVCSETLDLKVDYKNATLKNPFFGANQHKGCLLLRLT